MATGPFPPATTPPAFQAPPDPARVDLRPLSTSELIDRGFTLYRNHFPGLLLLALLCQGAPLIGQLLVTEFRLNPTQNQMMDDPVGSTRALGLIFGAILGVQLISFCFWVVMTSYISDAYLGKIPSVKECLRHFIPRIVPALWTSFLTRILICLSFLFPIGAVAASIFYVTRHPEMKPGTLIGVSIVALLLFIVSLIPVLVTYMRLMVFAPAVALENLSGWKAIARSLAIVRYDPGLGFLYWGEMRLSFLLLPLFAIRLLITFLTSLPILLHQFGELARHGAAGDPFNPPPDSLMITSQILTYLAVSAVLPLYVIATTLFYYDIRIRREGFDLEFMTRQMKSGP